MQDGLENTEQKSSQVPNQESQKKDEPSDQLFHIGANLICQNRHYFVYKSGIEVMCTKCPLGYPILPGTEIKNGHLYIHGEFVI